jgi:hypothetical protein
MRGLLVVAAIAAATLSVRVSASAAGPVAVPAISLGYYNALPGFDFAVTGRNFTPYGRADVFIAEGTRLLEHDVIAVSAQGTFTDTTLLPCDFHTHEARAYDRHSRQLSNIATLGGVCPG